MTTFPIPDAALDDRLGFVGTAGAGKTYNAGSGVERILAQGGRVIVPDPLGVWWGLGLEADGVTPAPWRASCKLVIFGGEQGDLPINEQAGALIGETVAGMAESVILDLSGFGTKAAEVRFMLAFLTALYRHANNEPVHLIFDEADMWAPQQERDKGEAPKLLGMMETVIRRGRVRGFIPWLISQRPAVLNKNVLSMVDGLVALKLTSSQDRAAIGSWIEGQADREEGKRILGSLPTMQQGQGVVWVPARGVLETVQFPAKRTFDSSRTPKRGETKAQRELKPLNLERLKGKLASIEEEAKANDPRALKAEVARLTRDLANMEKTARNAVSAAPAPAWPDQRELVASLTQELAEHAAALERLTATASELQRRQQAALAALGGEGVDIPSAPPTKRRASPAPAPVQRQPAPVREVRQSEGNGDIKPAQRRILDALAWWAGFGINRPRREQVAFIAGYSPTSGGLFNLLGGLRTSGLLDYPAAGEVELTDAGRAEAATPDIELTRDAFHAQVRSKLKPAQVRVLDPILAAWPDEIASDAVADAAGYSPTSGGFFNLRGHLRTLGLIDYPGPGRVRARDWLFP